MILSHKANKKESFLFVQFVGPIALALDFFLKKQKHVKIKKEKKLFRKRSRSWILML